jgi:folate-binding protein YgfZ
MYRTPLYDKLAAIGANMGEYCGAETATSFGDAQAEFAALTGGCGLYDLGWRARFRIAGRDRIRWLNGMVSNNIRELPAGRGNYNFVLNPQGHIQGDLYVYNCGESFLAGTERSQFDHLLALLRRYIIMDQVELTDANDELTALGIQGPQAKQVLGKTELQLASADRTWDSIEALELLEVAWHGHKLLATRMADSRFETYEIWLPPSVAGVLWDELASAGATPVGMDALEMFRVAAGVPRYGLDIGEKVLPQETGQMHALNFSKGCYIGQEIVERIRSRGSVHRSFTGFIVEGPVPSYGAKIKLNDKEVGEVTSALAVPLPNGTSQVFALGYIRREAAQPSTKVEVNGAPATVTPPPFPEVSATAQ